jgi:hypothetical protein
MRQEARNHPSLIAALTWRQFLIKSLGGKVLIRQCDVQDDHLRGRRDLESGRQGVRPAPPSATMPGEGKLSQRVCK